GTLDGAALTSGGGTITEFDFRNLVGGVHGVQVMSTGVGAWQSNTYIDNVVLEAIPEPATLGLLGLGSLAALVVRRFRI
ncbi:MAG: PEP-CTERM sorting domain-containing protein, partial [Verrucomicrobiota bacterium]